MPGAFKTSYNNETFCRRDDIESYCEENKKYKKYA